MRHRPARRIPASSKDASCALMHLDLPQGSVEGAIGGKIRGDRKISGWLDCDAKEGEGARDRRKCRGSGSPVAYHSPYIAVVTRQIREPLLCDDYTKSYRWFPPTASLTTLNGATSATRLADPITPTVVKCFADSTRQSCDQNDWFFPFIQEPAD